MQIHLNHRRWGSGKPLIILHGLFGSSDNWQTIGRRLSQKRSVFALDLRNHGDSPHRPDMGYAAMAEDLKGFMAEQGLDTAVLMGHSLGGKVIMAFADRYPEAAERMIVVDIAPKPYSAAHRYMVSAMINLDLNRIRSRQDALDALAATIPSLAVRQFLLKSLARSDDGTYGWKINLDAIDRYLDELSEGPYLRNAYPNPALYIRGGASDYITPNDISVIRRCHPKARIATIEGAGHWLHAEAQNETVDIISGFLDS